MELVVVCELWLRVMGSEDIGSCARWHHFSSQAAQTQIEKKHMNFKTQTHCVLQSLLILSHDVIEQQIRWESNRILYMRPETKDGPIACSIASGPTHFDINGNNPDNIALVKIMDLSE